MALRRWRSRNLQDSTFFVYVIGGGPTAETEVPQVPLLGPGIVAQPSTNLPITKPTQSKHAPNCHRIPLQVGKRSIDRKFQRQRRGVIPAQAIGPGPEAAND